jgi:hypothetical protein
MRKLLFALLVIAACQRDAAPPPAAPTPPAPTAQPAPPDRAAATEAYNAKQFRRCAEMYAALAVTSKSQDDYYNAACCYALDGSRDDAFAMLERANAAGFRDETHLLRDTDLTSLHADARWSKHVAAVRTANDAYERSLGDPALRRELLALVQEDQAVRQAAIQSNPGDTSAAERMAEVDRKTTARMKEVVAKYGWPGKKLVGEDGAQAAWLMVQHADQDRAFQKQCLPLIEAAARAGDVAMRNYAYLYDRVAVGEDRPQRYGTQYRDGKPAPIEDEAKVDERRKAVGLGTMAEYDAQMRAVYGKHLTK